MNGASQLIAAKMRSKETDINKEAEKLLHSREVERLKPIDQPQEELYQEKRSIDYYMSYLEEYRVQDCLKSLKRLSLKRQMMLIDYSMSYLITLVQDYIILQDIYLLYQRSRQHRGYTYLEVILQ
jgi:hypothetical protein